MRTDPAWTGFRVRQLHELWAWRSLEGTPLCRRQIAARLGVSINALVGRLAREYAAGALQRRAQQVPEHGLHIDADGQHHKADRPRNRKPVVAVRSLRDHGTRTHFKINEAVIAARTVPRAEIKGSLVPRHTCQWPLWAHELRPPRPPAYCGAPVEQYYDYCALHCRCAFTPWRPELRAALANR